MTSNYSSGDFTKTLPFKHGMNYKSTAPLPDKTTGKHMRTFKNALY